MVGELRSRHMATTDVVYDPGIQALLQDAISYSFTTSDDDKSTR